MHIRDINIEGSFKAFSGLELHDLPPTRFVILVGPNGSGKSSVFDALLYWAQNFGGRSRSTQAFQDYYAHPDGTIAQRIEVTFHDAPAMGPVGRKVHVRSAYRFNPPMRVSGVGNQPSIIDQPAVSAMNEPDSTAMRHYISLVSQFMQLLSDLTQEARLSDVRSQLQPLASAVNKLFPNLILESLGSPLQDGSFFFSKNGIKNFRFDNLSSGEKAAFDLLLDLYMAGTDFADGVICLDEPETHLNPRIQAALLDSINDLVPQTCQVWIASHSVGLLRRALELYQEDRNAVTFISFEEVTIGTTVRLGPAVVDRTFWQKALGVALGDLGALVAPQTVFLCEGSTDRSRDASTYAWDARIYRMIFGADYPQIDFVSVGGKAELSTADEIATVIVPGSSRLRLRDRDDLTDTGRQDALTNNPDLRILKRRTLENYLVGDEILTKLVVKHGLKPNKSITDIMTLRDGQIAAKSDDAKAALGAVFEATKATLQNNGQLGENKYQFARDVLAPLITSDTETYQELKEVLKLS